MNRKAAAILIASLLVATVAFSYYLLPLPLQTQTASGGNGNNNKFIESVEATLNIHHVSATLDKNLVYEGFTATGCGQSFNSASFWTIGGILLYFSSTPTCAQGWTYTIDPTVTITNEGHDFIQGKLYGVVHANTLVTTDYATILGISTSGTGIAVTDNYASAGPCDSANIYNTVSSGAQPAAATTTTAGTPLSGSVSTTLAITFSITTTISSAAAACILTETVGSSHPYIFGEVAFGPDSFVSGDSLTTTYTMTSS